MPAQVQTAALLTQGLRAEFANVYNRTYSGVEQVIKDVIWFDATSNKVQELYGYLDATPYPVRWPIGDVIPSKGMGSTQFFVTNRDFGRRIYLPRNYQDEQTGTAMQAARRLGSNWRTLPERIFFQYIQAGTDTDLLPAIPNSADGNALYLTTTRYGSSSGNVVSVTGTSNVQDVITDVYGVQRRFLELQDTESEPYWDAADLAKGMTIFYGPSLTQIMKQAQHQTLVHHTIAGSSTTDVQTGAAVSNTLMAAGEELRYVSNQRITDSNYYCFLNGLPNERRPLVRQIREGVTEALGNWETSDVVRDVGTPYVQFKSREGWGSALAIGTIRVS